MGIISQIHVRYNSFTNTEKLIADYVLKDPQKIIHMSITELADACGVAESSVFRFCKALDFKGYQEFKIALVHTTSQEREIPYLSEEITIDDSIQNLASKALATNIRALNETFELINADDISETVDAMIKANRIYFFGVGASLMTALEAKSKFMRITNKTECVMDSHLQVMSASLMKKDDVAVIISYSGSTKDNLEVAEIARERQAKVVCITRFLKSPLTTFADITLICGANEGPLQGGSLSAKLSQLYLLDILYLEYFKRTHVESFENKEITAQSVVGKMV